MTDSADPVPELPHAPSVDVASPPSIVCPDCGAKLRNVNAAAGARIRCLNCGANFDPTSGPPQSQSAQDSAAAISHPINNAPPAIREPMAAGYWILRIPATIFAVLSAASFVFGVVLYCKEVLLEGSFRGNVEDFLPTFALPLLPIGAYFAFVTPQALARLEARTLKVAWREKLIQQTLPAAAGSSLPYVLPLAAGPATIFLSLLGQLDDIPGLLQFGVFSFFTFVAAFMLDDFRQFTWRQTALADTLAKNAAMETGLEPVDEPAPSKLSWLGMFGGSAVLMLTAAGAMLFLKTLSEWNSFEFYSHLVEVQAGVVAVLTGIGVTVTIGLTGRNIRNAGNAWRRAAISAERSPHRRKLPEPADTSSRLMHLTLLIFALVGSFALLLTDRGAGLGASIPLLFFAAILLTVSGYMTARLVSILRSPARPTHGPEHSRAQNTLWITGVILYFCAIWSALLVIFLICDAIHLSDDSVVLLLVILGGNLTCLALARLYQETRRWRHAQTRFWMTRLNLTRPPVLRRLDRILLWITLTLCAIDFVLLVLATYNLFSMFSRTVPGEIQFDIFLGSFALTFPIVFASLMVREVMLVQALASQLNPRLES